MRTQDFLELAPGKLVKASAGYWAFVPNPLPPEIRWTPELVSQLSDADRELAGLASLGTSFPNPHIMVKPFIRREAVLSSRIEGTQTTLEQLYTYEAVQLPLFEPAPDAQEVYNYVRALDYGLERLKTLPVSLRLIREMHAKLMEGVRGEASTPGKFRRSQNWIGPPESTLQTAAFVPPPVDEMYAALDQLEKFIHARSELPLLIRLGLLHYQFEAIHPFLDGNGRLGRLLIILLLCEWGLLPQPLMYLSAYFDANRQEYYQQLLAISQRGDWEAWLLFFLRGVRDQARESALRLARLKDLRATFQQRLQGERTLARLMQVVDFLLGSPIVSVRQVQAGIGASDYKIAQRCVTRLEQHGIIREITGQARNRLYRVDEVMQVFLDPPG